MTFEVIQSKVIDGGSWQYVIIGIAALASFFQAWQDLVYTFISLPRIYFCQDMIIYSTNQSDLMNWHFNDTNKQCPMQIMNKSQDQSTSCQNCCYDFSDGRTSVVNEWDLICGKSSLVSTTQAAYAIGGIIGGFLYGYIGDRWGRQLAVVVSAVHATIFSISSCFSPNYIAFAVLRFVTAVGVYGQAIVSYVICSEICTEGVRPMLGSIMLLPYTLGYLSLAGISYILTPWNYILLSVSAPNAILALLCLAFIPESLRWLMINNQEDRALKTLHKVSKWNRKKIAESELKDMLASYSKDLKKQDGESDNQSDSLALLEIFKNGELRKRMLICYLLWFAASLGYYGMAYNASAFGDDIYFTSALMSGDQIVSVFVVIVLLRLFPRKVVLIVVFFLGALACLLIPAVPIGTVWAVQLLVVVGNFMFSIIFSAGQVVTVELFPSTMRNIAFGTAYAFAAVGLLAASYVAQLLGEVYTNGPIIVFGVFALASALFTFFLPETKTMIFPDSTTDIQKNKNSMSTCTLDSTVL